MRFLKHGAGVVCLLMGVLLPSTIQAQQIGGGPVRRAPVFGETGMVHDRGGLAIGAAFGQAKISTDLFDVTETLFAVGGSFGVTPWLTIGAAVPFESSSLEIDGEEDKVSGMGDASLQARVRIFGQGDEGATAAILGTAVFPTADDELVPENTFRFAVGGGFSYAASPVSFHAAADVELASDEAYEEVISYSGAIGYTPSDRFVVNGEFLGFKTRVDDDEETEEEESSDPANYAGASARVFLGAGRNLYLDGGVLFGITDEAFDNIFTVGLGWTR